MRYKEFFEIKLEHSYTANILEYLVLNPDKPTIGLIKKNHLLLKKTVSGFKILMPVNEQGNSLATFRVDDTLTFNMFPLSQYFFEFTNFSTINGGNVFLFTNQGLSHDSFDLLASENAVNNKLNGFPAIGQIKITSSDIETATDGAAPVYKVGFNAKLVTWKYFFITKEASDSLSVESKDVVFEKLKDEALDPVFNGLKANFTSSELHIRAFESEEPLACQSSPRKDIQLKNDNITVIKHLPNPEIGDHGIKIIRIN